VKQFPQQLGITFVSVNVGEYSAFETRDEETQQHKMDLLRAAEQVSQTYPDMEVN